MPYELDLKPLGITVKRLLRNPSPAKMYEEALQNEKGTGIVNSGALVALSGSASLSSSPVFTEK